jgi:hypothetical protein
VDKTNRARASSWVADRTIAAWADDTTLDTLVEVPWGAKRILPPDIRGDASVPFGPVVEVSPDAAPYVQLAAWLGGHP